MKEDAESRGLRAILDPLTFATVPMNEIDCRGNHEEHGEDVHVSHIAENQVIYRSLLYPGLATRLRRFRIILSRSLMLVSFTRATHFRGSTLANLLCSSNPGMETSLVNLAFEPNVSGDPRWGKRE